MNRNNINVWWEELKSMLVNYDLAWNHYVENTGAMSANDRDWETFILFRFIKYC